MFPFFLPWWKTKETYEIWGGDHHPDHHHQHPIHHHPERYEVGIWGGDMRRDMRHLRRRSCLEDPWFVQWGFSSATGLKRVPVCTAACPPVRGNFHPPLLCVTCSLLLQLAIPHYSVLPHFSVLPHWHTLVLFCSNLPHYSAPATSQLSF